MIDFSAKKQLDFYGFFAVELLLSEWDLSITGGVNQAWQRVLFQ